MATIMVPRIKLGSQGLEVSAQGLGCMGMSANYGAPKPEADMINLIHYALNSGVTFLDTSDIYGPHTNEILLAKLNFYCLFCIVFFFSNLGSSLLAVQFPNLFCIVFFFSNLGSLLLAVQFPNSLFYVVLHAD